MYWSYRYWGQNRTVTRGTTTLIELPTSVSYGGIFLRFQCRKASGNPLGSSAYWRLIDYVSEINLIGNGKTVLKSLPATAYHAQAVFDKMGFPPRQFREYSQDIERFVTYVNFGRFFQDPEMYLPANAFNSLEMTIKFDGTSSDWQEDIALDIVFIQPSGSGVPASKGIIRSEVFRNITCEQDKEHPVTMPTGYPIRRIILQTLPALNEYGLEKTSIYNHLYNLKLTLKSGDVTVYDGPSTILSRCNALTLGGVPPTMGWIYHTADYGFYTGLGYVYTVAGLSGSRDGAASGTVPTIEGDRNSCTQKPESYEADSPFSFVAWGEMPESCVMFPFDHDLDPATWLNPEIEKDVDLVIKNRNTSDVDGGLIRVILDRYMPM